MNMWVFLRELNWNYQTIAAVVSIAAYLTIILLVIFKARRHPAMKWFVLANTAVIFWISGFCILSMVKDYAKALHFSRFFEVGAIFTTPLYMTLSFSVMKVSHNRNIVRGYYLGAVIFAIFNFCGSYFIKGIVAHKYSFALWYLLPGPLYYLFPIFFGAGVAYLCFRVYLQQKTEPQERKQAFLFIAGVVLATIGGLFYFLTIFFKIPIHFPHDYLTILLPLATMYNIIRYRLMEIDTVIHRTILWALMSLGLLIPIYFIVSALRGWLARLSDLWLAMVEMTLFYVFLWYYHYFQPRIDHLFRRRKYDYYKVLGEIGQKIGSELSIASVSSRLFRELRGVLYIRNGFLLVQEEKESDYIEIDSIGYERLLGPAKREKLTLSTQATPMSWFAAHQAVLERERVAEDPQYEEIKSEILELMEKEHVEILIPVIAENRVNALIGIGKKENLQLYTSRDIELLDKMGKQIGVTLENALHHEDIVEKERMAEELKLGKEIQTALLPKESPVIDGLVVSGLMLPAKEIGGDYYDYIVSSSEIVDSSKNQQTSGLPTTNSKLQTRLSVVIGDVSGKGVGAGLIMATAKSTIEAITQQREFSPKEVLCQTNRLMQKYTKGEKFMTMLYLEWDTLNKKMRYSSAGHEHIIIYRSKAGSQIVDSSSEIVDSRLELVEKTKNEQVPATNYQLQTTNSPCVEVIPSGGFVLGMLPEIEEYLEDKELMLNPGDKIVLYTDGITEAHNESNDMYSLERLAETVKQHGHKPTEELLTSVKGDVYGFMDQAEQFDDITLVVIEAI